MRGRKRSTPSTKAGKSPKGSRKAASARRSAKHLKAVIAGVRGAGTRRVKKREAELQAELQEAIEAGTLAEGQTVTAGEIVLFEAVEDEPRLSGFGAFDLPEVQRPDWLVHVEYRQEGDVESETDVRVQLRMEQESEGTAIRRELRSALQDHRVSSPSEESPAVAIQRIALVAHTVGENAV